MASSSLRACVRRPIRRPIQVRGRTLSMTVPMLLHPISQSSRRQGGVRKQCGCGATLLSEKVRPRKGGPCSASNPRTLHGKRSWICEPACQNHVRCVTCRSEWPDRSSPVTPTVSSRVHPHGYKCGVCQTSMSTERRSARRHWLDNTVTGASVRTW